jgi:oligo-1,6-glucosidase/alpha-glucosidase
MRSPQAHNAWWRHTTVYQIYPRSFADSNGDGIGDLPGIIGRLDHLQALGVETIWLSPFWRSPQADFGYDISDHYNVAPEYGTLADCRALIDAVHRRGMKIVFDMVLNHTSDQHPWFLESRRSRHSPRRDFYIWRDGRGGRRPPNNWRSMLGGSGWHRDEATGQWYWASFLPFQPDLNYRNPAVKRAMLDVVRHWLGEGVDGLRLDIFNALYKDAGFADNPPHWRPLPSEDDPNGFFQRCLHTIDHPDTLAFARELRAVVDEFTDPPRFLVGEVFGAPAALVRYCGERADGLHLVFLFRTLRTPLRAAALRALIAEFEAAFPEPLLPTYVFGNHDRPRLSCRISEDPARARLLATLQLTVRGVPFIYYGEEIGLPHQDLPLRQALDPLAAQYRLVPGFLARWLRRHGLLLNRDECRGPMPWHGGPGAGFTAPGVRPWLPLHPRSATLNVAAQERDPGSLLACYRRLLALRRGLPALHGGDLTLLPVERLPRDVLAYRRAAGDQAVEVYLNLAPRPAPLDDRRPRLFSTHGEGTGDGLRPWEGIVVPA